MRTVLLAFLMCLQPLFVAAQETSSFPSVPINAKTLRVQEQAEEIYQRSDYKRAFFIYRNELAPIGDKYGQYMVGFMYLAGKGVPEDRVAASAWYRLAAERGTEEFVRARNGLMKNFDTAETARSNQMFIGLRKQYGDLALLMQAVRADYELLRNRTGSRLSSDSGVLTIIEPGRAGATQSGVAYYGRIERRLQARLEYIARRVQIEIADINVEKTDMLLIEAKVNERLDKLD
jgi:TPR repeat protein